MPSTDNPLPGLRASIASTEVIMATLTIRNLPESTRRALKERAAAHNRSMEAEVRDILDDAVRTPNFLAEWVAAAEAIRGEFLVPERSIARDVDLS